MLASGLLAGIAGGIAMIAVAAIGAAWEDLPALHSLQIIGESFVGPGAFGGAAAQAAFGALVHLATAAALGILFASIVPPDFPHASAVGTGVGFALFTLMFMMGWVVPLANEGFRSGMQNIGGTWVVAHAVFGTVLGTAPALRRRIGGEASDASAPGSGPARRVVGERPSAASSGALPRARPG